MANKTNELSHTKWLCKYHIVFTPKYRRKIIFNQYSESLIEFFKRLCSYKDVEIIEGHMMPDHVHLLVSIPPKIAVSTFVGYLKGKSALMMFDKYANLKYKFGNRHFWAEGYSEPYPIVKTLCFSFFFSIWIILFAYRKKTWSHLQVFYIFNGYIPVVIYS